MLPFPNLDLAPIPERGSAADALASTVNLARHAGYRRFWRACTTTCRASPAWVAVTAALPIFAAHALVASPSRS
jgi:hypothetical protein